MTDSPTPDPVPTVAPKAQGLMARVQAILLKPAETWDVIAGESTDVKSLYMGYVFPLAAIGPVATAVGLTLFSFGFLNISWIVLSLVWFFAVNLGMVYAMALVIDGLAPNFGGEKNFIQAFKLSAYSMTAAWLVGIIALVPILFPLAILGLYSVYLLYVGLPKLMKSPAEKSVAYVAVVILVAFVIGLVAGAVSKNIGGAGFGGLHHGVAASNDGKLSGKIKLNGVSVDMGKLQQAGEQMAAEASAQQNGTTTVKVADPQVLLGLMPGNFMGAARTDDSTTSGGAAGITVATAQGHYDINGNTIELQISDLGSVSGLGAMAAAMNVNSSSSSGTGYSKVTTQNGQMISEEYDRESKYGKYTVIRNGRISVEASGTVDSIDTLKSLVNGLDGGKLEGLSKG